MLLKVQPNGPEMDFRPYERKFRPLFLGEQVEVLFHTIGLWHINFAWLSLMAVVEQIDEDGTIHAVVSDQERNPNMPDSLYPPDTAVGSRFTCQFHHVWNIFPPVGEEWEVGEQYQGRTPLRDGNGE